METVIVSKKEDIQEMLNSFINKLQINASPQVQAEAKTELLTRDQIMEFLNIKETTLWLRMRDGSLPFKRIGRRILFDKAEVLAAISTNKKGL